MKGIPEGRVLGIDTMVFIYHLEDHPAYSHITGRLFDEVEEGKYRALTSFITLLEILVKPKQENQLKAVADYRDLLLSFPHLKFFPVDQHVSEIASTVRAKYSVKTPDAIQVATAIARGADLFITNDEQLKKIKEIDVVLLEQWKK